MLFNEDWVIKLQPIIDLYKTKKHPLNYKNQYQLIIMVLLSAQDADVNINKIASSFFEKYPNFKSINQSTIEELSLYISKVKNYQIKASWVINISQQIIDEENIPMNLKNLTALKGIGRKSANVILREFNKPAEGIICDLHVIRVSSRIGLVSESKNGDKIEKELMQRLPYSIWNEIGMSLSFLGRETCRPIPKCEICPIKKDCKYYLIIKTKKPNQ